MRQRIAVQGLVLAFLLLGSRALVAQDDPKPKKEPEPKKTTYVVARVNDGYEIVEKSGVAALKKASDARYKAALASWTARKKEAKKEKKPFSDPKPRKETIKVFGSTFDSREKAEAFVKAEREKAEKKKKKDTKSPRSRN